MTPKSPLMTPAPQPIDWIQRLPKPLQAYCLAARDCLSDWMTDLGLAINVIALFSFAVALVTLPVSELLSAFLNFYRGVRNSLYIPLEAILAIKIAPPLKDALLFWALTGVIGARTTIWLFGKFFQQTNSALLKLDEPGVRERTAKRMGQAKFDGEVKWIEEQREQFKPEKRKKVITYVGCLLTGPLFFVQIWRLKPPTPDQKINGRQMIVVQVLTLIAGVGILFVLNWATR